MEIFPTTKKEKTMHQPKVHVAPEVLTIILAGGQGSRLAPLTELRAKPGVPFAGKYRIIDFPLANSLNSGYRKIFVLLQYASLSLRKHLRSNWDVQTGRDGFVTSLYPKMRTKDEYRYTHTANAVWQNLDEINEIDPDFLLILSGDHVYKMDYRQKVDFHVSNSSDFTISATRVPIDVARGELGVLVVDEEYRVIGFQEKPEEPISIPGDPGYCLASMGNYLIPLNVAQELLKKDAEDSSSAHDFGSNIIPSIIESHRVFAYPFESNKIEGENNPVWSDVGTILAFFNTCLDFCAPVPKINLYNRKWPIPSGADDDSAPAKFVKDRLLVSGSCIVNDAQRYNCVLHTYVRVEDGASLINCIVMDYSTIGAGVQMKNVIVDRSVHIPDGIKIGYDREEDKAREFTIVDVDDYWITVIPKGYQFIK